MIYNQGSTEQGGAILKSAPGFKKNSQTCLLKLNLVPLGAGRGGYLKRPAPLPSLDPPLVVALEAPTQQLEAG